jgi:hypothetical protein
MIDLFSTMGGNMSRVIRRILLLAILILTLIPLGTVHADVAPPPAPGLGGLAPFEYQKTSVQLVYERVEMELHIDPKPEDPDYPVNFVTVDAWFVMHNQGNIAEQMRAMFPIGSLNDCRDSSEFPPGSNLEYRTREDSFVINIDGKYVPTEKISTKHPYADRDPYCEQMDWMAFNASFPVNKDVLIRISYTIDVLSRDSIHHIQYILETGAAWKGPIGKAYVIFRFPYLANNQNVLSATSPGYQALYNEIFWSYENLEPTAENNIDIVIVEPDTWKRIVQLKDQLKENLQSPQAWIELAQIYTRIATIHGPANIREDNYIAEAYHTYDEALAANPNSADLHAAYAEFLLEDHYYYYESEWFESLSWDGTKKDIFFHMNRALALDPKNKKAREVQSWLQGLSPHTTFTPPATIPPTLTPTWQYTPTPTATRTPRATQRPKSTSTPTQRPTATDTAMPPTPTPTAVVNAKPAGNSWILITIHLVVLAAAASIIWFLYRRGKK